MTAFRKWTLVVALSLILGAVLVLRQRTQVPRKSPPTSSGTILSVYQAARAAGATVEGDSVEEIVNTLMGGVTGAGSFGGTTFQVPQLSAAEFDTVLRDLRVGDGILTSRAAQDEPP